LTAKFLVFRASHRRSAKLMRDGPRFFIPTFSITNETKKSIVIQDMGIRQKKVYP
jgi:hypothetical protein